jgi:bacterioferritin
MKGHAKVIQILNERLAEELTAISQYMVHSEMCANWGFQKLHEAIEKQAIDEMKHAETLIGRILFLEGSPTVSKLHKIKIGKTVEEIVAIDEDDELDAVKAYNDSIAAAADAGDNSTADMLTKILGDEERHVEWGETQRWLIKQMGLQNYLATQA